MTFDSCAAALIDDLAVALLEPTPIVTDAGHAAAFEDTLARVQPLLPRVPISRVSDETPLDPLRLPVWSAVTPLAKDLKVHAGKGTTAAAARCSAIMEAIERVCAESVPEERAVRTSFNELASRGSSSTPVPLDPMDFDLPFDTSYVEDAVVTWCAGYELVARRPVLVATDLVVSPPTDGICRGVETNGLAAGNTYLEATVHAMYEVMERHALSSEEFYAQNRDVCGRTVRAVRCVDPATLPSPAAEWVGRIRANGLALSIQLLENDWSLPIYAASILDTRFPRARGRLATFGGYGADLDAARAAVRAVTEAVQSRMGFLTAARDDFEGLRPIPLRESMLLRRLEVLFPTELEPFDRGASRSSGDLARDLEQLVSRLARSGYATCVVIPLTRADLGVPVVRVLVTGLAAPWADSARRPPQRLLQELL